MKKRKVLLVGWDAADWKVISPLVDEGLMPNVARLVENGVTGNLATLYPIYSPMLWTSIATGKRPYKHGIHGFSEPDPSSGMVRPVTNLSRKTKAVWNILNQEGLHSNVVGWWPSSPAEPIRGCMVSNHFQQAVADLDKPWPMRPGTVYPPKLSQELAEMRIHPMELDGDMLRTWVPRAPEIDQKKDRRLMTLAKIVAECSGIHAAATHLMHTRPDWDFMAVYYDAIDHFGHAFMRYHPPRLDWVEEGDFEMYKDVVRGGYIYHDMMLGVLMDLAGPDTTVILMSDHGFHPDHLRPKSLPNEPAGPAAEHRQFGIFVASGPEIRKDELIFGARVLDITPTILSLFGLPTGRDMDGRVLSEIYETPQKAEFIDSWDAVPGEDGRHPEEMQLDPVDSQEALRQLVALGYIDEPSEDASKAVEETTRELRYNLAMSLVDAGKHLEAAAIFSELWERWPQESRFGVKLLNARMEVGQILEARETMGLLQTRKKEAAQSATKELEELFTELQKKYPPAKEAEEKSEEDNTKAKPPQVELDWEKVPENEQRKLRRLRRNAGVNPAAFAFLEGSLLHLEGRNKEALDILKHAAGAQTANLPSLYLKMAEVCLALRDWEEAAVNYRRILELDTLNAAAHLGLARTAFHSRDWQTAADEAMTSAGLLYHNARAHYIAGCSLLKLEKKEDGVLALERAISVNPVYPAAHRRLASYYLKQGEWELCRKHLQLARQAMKRIRKQRAVTANSNAHPQEFRESFGKEEDLDRSPLPSVSLPPLGETVVVVTGLPRSGTSMMMQMLQAGGVPVLVDSHRPADESNELGYLEYEPAKALAKDSSWVTEAKGQAVKLVAQLIPSLPKDFKYRLIMMHRPLSEVIPSQRKMLDRLGKDGARLSDDALKMAYQRQITQVRSLLRGLQKKGVLDVLDIKYHDVLENPVQSAKMIAEFLGGDFNEAAAANVVAPDLCHEVSDKA
ncbi:MAG: alkaline phosphatase family protein [Chthoniobacterales bacterium]